MNALDLISPAELAADILNRLSVPGFAPSGAVVGPASDIQQQAGVVSVVAAGLPVVEKYLPEQWLRAQMRCLAPVLAEAEAISQRVFERLNGQVRVVARMASTDHRYLVHLCNVTAGPSMHYDSPETWETLLFAELCISTEPLD